MRKSLQIPFVNVDCVKPDRLTSLFDECNIPWHAIDECNWAKEFPYAPDVHFRIAHTKDSLLLQYDVVETDTAANSTTDGQDVYIDSCVEFFLSPFERGNYYYNLECNCVGTMILGLHRDGHETQHATPEMLSKIERWSSLGLHKAIKLSGEVKWQVGVVVPYSVFWMDAARIADTSMMRANFYKCGDNLPRPHFLSWSPIVYSRPNFHLPEFFGDVELCS